MSNQGPDEIFLIHPVCFSCNRVIGHLTNDIEEILESKGDIESFLTSVGIPPTRYCCRRMLLSPIRGYYLYSDPKLEMSGETQDSHYETFENLITNPMSEEKKKKTIEKVAKESFEKSQTNLSLNDQNSTTQDNLNLLLGTNKQPTNRRFAGSGRRNETGKFVTGRLPPSERKKIASSEGIKTSGQLRAMSKKPRMRIPGKNKK